MDDESGMPMPFATQFFNDDGDFGPDYDDDLAMGDDVGGLEGIGPGYDGADSTSAPPPDTEAELLAAMQSQAKRVRPEHVNYAKKAKRVDVRKLKENIWRELRLEVRSWSPTAAILA
jgi:condensin complex subunit 2